MSDRASLQIRDLTARIAGLEAQVTWSAARIAELEAERDKIARDAQHALDVLGHRVHKLEAERDAAVQRDNVNAALTRAAIKKSDARIAELEAEVARLTALQLPADLSRGEALAYRSEDHGPAKKPIR